MSSILNVCAKFYNNPQKSFGITDFEMIDDYNYGSVKTQINRLIDYGIVKRLKEGEYILDNPEKAFEFLESNRNTLRRGSETPPYPHRVRAKAHNISVGEIDLSGEPIEWLQKFNMLTKPKGDNAQNVNLKKEHAKKFNLRISLKTSKGIIYPKADGWEDEFLGIFNWCEDFISRLWGVKDNLEIAINYRDLQRMNPSLRNVPFEEINGLVLPYKGMRIQLCKSQFTDEGEVCILSKSKEETCSLVDKITYRKKDLSQALRETSLEREVRDELRTIREDLPSELARIIVKAMKDTIKEAVRDGILEANQFQPSEDSSRPEVR